MKLFMNEGSPFARKARIFAREKGLSDRIQEVVTAVSPVDANSALARENPLIKIPVLVTDDGARLYDSGVICEYLDTLHERARAFPSSGPARFETLGQQALCDGALDAAILCRYELALRPVGLRWNEWIEGQRLKIGGALSVLETEAQSWPDEFEMAQIGAVCVLGYLDFRFPEWEWRRTHPQLAGWYRAASIRPSVVATAPA
ncbi:glutathione S-transferase [Variovorax rhizosphaerae]|uniref:Glutathione S-transferase n=1 Tax=Variovorax rhizosphaerae TaxID=1836200 RepID=A0ABU8WQH9_9BURK